MRLFASDKIIGVMDKLGMEEGQVLEHPWLTKAIENAQKRVEGRNFEIRKHLLEYDDVMNSQREFIYRERNEILDGEDISDKIKNYIGEVIESALEYYTAGSKHAEDWDIEGMDNWLKTSGGVRIAAITKAPTMK